MRAKIIADIAIVGVVVMFIIWWTNTVPFPCTLPFVLLLSTLVGIALVLWVHQGK